MIKFFRSLKQSLSKKSKISLIIIASILLLLVGVSSVCYTIVNRATHKRIYSSIKTIPHNTYGLLLGTSPVTPKGWPNQDFRYRVMGAEQLYKAGKIDTIIASGGDFSNISRDGWNEVKAMHDSLVARGVPPERIITDYDGRRTVFSVRNVKNKYRLDSITVISQKFHCERAIYIADHSEIAAIGYDAGNHPIFKRDITGTHLRENLARMKMLFYDLM